MACAPAWAQTPGSAAAEPRKQPLHPVVLRSPALEVILDRADGLPYEYRLLPDGVRFRGEDFGVQVAALIYARSGQNFSSIPLAAAKVTSTPKQADFYFQVNIEQKPAASFVLRYTLDAATVHVTVEDVQEAEDHQLIEIAMPCLATIREEDGPAWLAHGDDGGHLVLLSEAKAGSLPPNTFWGKVNASLPVVMIGTDRAICVQEVTAFMDGTELSVVGDAGQRRACLGTVKVHRVNGSLCYDMNTGPGTPRVCGTTETPNLLIGQKSSCRLDFIGAPAGGQSLNWLDAAKLVRSRMPAIPTRYYDNKFVYGIHCDEPKWEKPGATFEECQKLIRDVATLTGSAPQVVHLWGWQYRGKDTGYPAVAEVNQRIGGYEGLMRLMTEARDFNCNVTFSDNYDDAYRSSPAWDENIIARRPDGGLWKSRNWTGEDSYVVGLAKYMQGPGVQRIRQTCERYKLRETTHVDVLSYYPIRNDWDHAHPASGIKNLHEGRYKVLAEFAKYNVDVSSEALRYAFTGKITFYWNMATPRSCPFGGKPIPLMPAIYRQSAIWGEGGRSIGPVRALNLLFYGSSPHLSVRSDTDRAEITDVFYLLKLPWFKLHSRNIEWFHRAGDKTSIGLEGNSQIDLDWSKNSYAVTIEGIEIARDGSTFCLLDENRIAFYSLEAKELSAPFPKDWDSSKIAAVALFTDHPEEAHVAVEAGKLKISVPARRPVMVYRDGESARRRKTTW